MNQTGWNLPISQLIRVKILLLKMVPGWNPLFFFQKAPISHPPLSQFNPSFHTKPTGRHYTKTPVLPGHRVKCKIPRTSCSESWGMERERRSQSKVKNLAILFLNLGAALSEAFMPTFSVNNSRKRQWKTLNSSPPPPFPAGRLHN